MKMLELLKRIMNSLQASSSKRVFVPLMIRGILKGMEMNLLFIALDIRTYKRVKDKSLGFFQSITNLHFIQECVFKI